MIETLQLTICDVHRILDFDCSLRWCSYCGLCDARICQECKSQLGRRLKAAIKRKLEPGYRGVPNYEETAAQEIVAQNKGEIK